MVQLSFVEEIKDKASRLIPTAYMEIVEECTAPHLLIPTYEHVKFLCETVNKKSEAVVDVVRAVRRRITDNDVAVKHLTVQLLESMVKNSTTAFHVEVASQKGLLRDLVGVACMQPTTGRAMQAKEAALLLTLNLSIWFRGHPAEECFILTTLADDVRNQLGPNCFEGIEPERNTRMRVQVNNAAAARSHPRHDSQGTSGRSAVAGGRRPPSSSSQRHERRNVVDAIPINLPTPERVSAMLDVCMTFSEYLTNAEMNTERPLKEDEVVQSYLSQVKADHDYVTILLSSNLQIDRDVLRTVGDSQSAVLAKVEQSSTRPPAVPLQQTPVRSAGDTEDLFQQPPQQQHQTSPLAAQHATPPRRKWLPPPRRLPQRRRRRRWTTFLATQLPLPPPSPPSRRPTPSLPSPHPQLRRLSPHPSLHPRHRRPLRRAPTASPWRRRRSRPVRPLQALRPRRRMRAAVLRRRLRSRRSCRGRRGRRGKRRRRPVRRWRRRQHHRLLLRLLPRLLLPLLSLRRMMTTSMPFLRVGCEATIRSETLDVSDQNESCR